MEQNPMSLEDLPNYLKSLKEKGKAGDCFVDMGKLESKPVGFWSQKSVIMAICLFLGTGGMIGYNLTSNNQITVFIDLNNKNNSIESISQMIANSGGEMIDLKQNEDFTYEVKISTRKSRRSFLYRLLKNENIKEAK